MVVKFKKMDSRAEMPTRGSREAAGYDMAVVLDEAPEMPFDDYEMLAPFETRKFRSGIAIELPPGYYARIEGRSHLVSKGLNVIHGIIDSDYRGEIKIVIQNASSHWEKIHDGEKLAQIIVQKHETIEWEEAETLAESERGTGGFGSTGA